MFSQGIKVPADMIVLEGQDIVCDEGELTGEPIGIMKEAITRENYKNGGMATMIAKSLITAGTGKGLVVAVGPNTVSGVITTKTQAETEPTLLQRKLETIADKIGRVGILCAALTFASMVLRLFLEMGGMMECGCQNITNCVKDDSCVPLSLGEARFWTELLNTVIICIAIIVAAIPEGLPLAVTISLSFSSKQMMKLNNLVRKLASSETMGGATHICSDKTGTLTQNKMTTMAFFANQKVGLAVSGDPDKNSKDLALKVKGEMNDDFYTTLCQGIMWNSSARVEVDEKTGQQVLMGNVTEKGILKFFVHQIGYAGIVDWKNQLNDSNQLELISFSSSRKRSSIVVKHNGGVRVYTKGAPDMIFPLLTGCLTPNGEKSLNSSAATPPELKQYISGSTATLMEIMEQTVKCFADKAYRTILITYKDMSMADFEKLKRQNNNFEKEADREIMEKDLVAVALFGLQDPLRTGIKESIQQVREAGIITIMCTGDNIDTAIAISKEANIVTEEHAKKEYACMTGKQFREACEGLT